MTQTYLRRTSGSLIIAIGAATILTVSLSTSPVQAAKPAPLFEQAATPGKAQPSAMATHTIRRSILTVNEKVVSSGAILTAEAQLLNLFPDVQLLATRRRVESRSSRDYSWFGYIPGDEFGRVILTVVNGTLGAAITHNGHRYVVLPIGDGNHEVVEIDRESFPEGDDVDRTPVQTYGGGGGSRGPAVPGGATPLDTGGLIKLLDLKFALSDGDAGPIRPLPDDGSVIDIMFVYTHGAAFRTDPVMIPPSHGVFPHWAPSNLLVGLQIAIDQANQAFEDSHVNTRLNRVGDPMEDTEYVENGVMAEDLNAVRAGWVNGVQATRNLLAADIVAFVTAGGTLPNGKPLCGQTRPRELQNNEYLNAAIAFLVVDATCLAGTYTLAHEVAHDMGTTHDWYRYFTAGETENVESRAHGYIAKIPNVNSARRTIMAYPDWCLASDGLQLAKYELSLRCGRIDRFSDQTQTTDDLGLPLGGVVHEVPFLAVADEVPILNANRRKVANYRLSACRSLASSPLCP